MADEISLEAGDEAENVVVGRGNQQSRQQSDPRQNMRSGNNYYGGDNHNGDQKIWLQAQIADHTNQLREHAGRLLELRLLIDDLPNKFIRLKDKVDDQTEKIKDLENLEVVVRRDDVVVRPITPPDAVILSTRSLLIVLLIAFVVLVAAVIYLIYLQAAANG